MQLMNIEWKWNIPNLLSLLRILLVPVFVILYLLSSDERMDLMYWSFGVLILSGVTDSLDGIIARKCNQITDLGKLLDPVADKLTQVAVVICLATRFSQLIPLVVICFVKELAQSIGGLILPRRGAEVRGASWYGKMCTFVFYGVMALIVLLPNMYWWVRVLLVTLVAVLMLFAFFNYMRVYLNIKKTLPKKEGASKSSGGPAAEKKDDAAS